MSMRIISLDGRLGNNAEVKTTKDGRTFVRFSVANNYFSNGREITDWFDVSCFDPYIVQNKIKFLTKGRYVIVTGNIRTEVTDSNGKLWINHYVTATNIDTPSFGGRKDDSTDASDTSVSVYTGGTRSDLAAKTVEEPVVNIPSPVPSEVPAYTSSVDIGNGDDLPF